MNSLDKVLRAQSYLREHAIDGWLLYDFRRNNPLALEFLEVPKEKHLSRRFFYYIPKEGEAVVIVHKIEPYVLDHMPGIRKIYQGWQDLQIALEETLAKQKSIAMEYSPYNVLPYISKVDGGTIDMVERCGVKVVSSAPFLQNFTSVLTEKQKNSQREAGQFLDKVTEETFIFLSNLLREKKFITEYELQQWVLQRFNEEDFFAEHDPICAFGENTANPHYCPSEFSSSLLKLDEPILLDFVAKRKEEGSVYGDITRMGFSGSYPSQQYKELFKIAKTAQQESFDFIKKRFEKGLVVKGYEVDEICRNFIKGKGYGSYFTHRTGHNIDQSVHGVGAHLDGFETFDDRPLILNTCFTIEPGVYLPGELGVRVEYDVLIHSNRQLEITGGIQEEIRCLI